MKKKLVYVLFACLAMVNMALGQQKESRLILNPEVPVAGQRLELTYNPKGGPLEGKSDLVGIIYMYNFYHWEMGDAPKVMLSELGIAIAKEEIPKIHKYYPQVEVWRVCIMPDHIHLIGF